MSMQPPQPPEPGPSWGPPPTPPPPAGPAQSWGPPPTPPPPSEPAKRTPWWRRWWAIAAAGGVVGLIIGLASAGGSSSTKTVAGPTVTQSVPTTVSATVTHTAQPTKVIATHTQTVRVTYTPPPPAALTEGTYVVGTDIQPGQYKTSGDPSGIGCYWARLSSLNTGDIIDNGNTTGITTIEVHSSDKALQLTGSCEWHKIG